MVTYTRLQTVLPTRPNFWQHLTREHQPKDIPSATHFFHKLLETDGDGATSDWDPEAPARCIQFVGVGILDVVPVDDRASHWQLVDVT
jgi:hypothetical protein